MVDYKIPDPEKQPVDCLVLSYKTLKGVEYNDRSWDKVHWGRCKKAAKQLLEVCGDLRVADKCLMEVSDRMEAQSLSWTLETVLRHVHDWFTQQQKREDKNNGLSPRARFFTELAKSRTEGQAHDYREGLAGSSLPSMLRSSSSVEPERLARSIRQPTERIETRVEPVLETKVNEEPPVERNIGLGGIIRLDELRSKRISRTTSRTNNS